MSFAGRPAKAGHGPGERECLVSLHLVPGLGPRRLAGLLDWFGSARAAWEAPAEALAQVPGLPGKVAAALDSLRRERTPEAIVGDLSRAGTVPVTLLDDDYPPDLRSIADCPPVLYVRGNPSALRGPAVAVVGTRRPSAYGLEVTAALARELAQAGVVVVSGLAVGVDAAAHRATVDAGGRTVAVIGSGLDRLYPAANMSLAAAVLRAGGAVISQFPADTLPAKGTFVARNRVVAGLVRGVVVTEAPSGSGALITAGFAKRLGRPVLAVPGPVTSRGFDGCLELLRRGARAVGCGEHVLDDLGLAAEAAARRPGQATAARLVSPGRAGEDFGRRTTRGSLPSHAETVLRCLEPGEVVPLALLSARTGLDPDQLGSALGLLEVRGLVSRQPGQGYARR